MNSKRIRFFLSDSFSKHLLLVGIASLLLLGSCSSEEEEAVHFVPVEIQKTFEPLPADTIQPKNPLTGFHQWRNNNVVPNQTPILENYQRYQWKDLEPQKDQYNFTGFLNDLNAANAAGRAFAFRIRMMAGYDDGIRYFPDWILSENDCAAGDCAWTFGTNPSTPETTFLPNWNHPYLLTRTEKLLSELGKVIPASAKIAFIDIGMYGQYGEWTVSSSVNYAQAPAGILPITKASKERYIEMHLAAFLNRQLLMFALRGNTEAIVYARQRTATGIPSGLRTDCLGRIGFFNQWENNPTDFAQIKDFWKTAPFVAEFCGFEASDASHSFTEALRQIRTYHITSVGNGNIGNQTLPISQRFNALPQADKDSVLKIGNITGPRIVLKSASISLNAHGTVTMSFHLQNTGTAPLYSETKLELLVSQGTTEAAKIIIPVNLEQLTASTGSYPQSGFAAQDLSGTYALRVAMVEVKTRRKILLSNRGMSADSTLFVGDMTFYRL